tara:strand:- start:1191 stop:1874 length:684 start_codon:yes stop_codon:yes gene_type:complete
MANRIGKFKITKREEALSLSDGNSFVSTLSSAGAATFGGTIAATGLITATAAITNSASGGTGAGLVGTGTAPSQTILTVNDEIITTTKIDLTGLKKKSDVGDVIGLDGTASAYIALYAVATHGLLHKIEISCVELPTATNALLDFDLIAHDTTTLTYDGDASGGTSMTAMGGNIALGQTYQSYDGAAAIVGQPTEGQAIYLAEGATSGDNVYTAGMIIVKMFGHKTF